MNGYKWGNRCGGAVEERIDDLGTRRVVGVVERECGRGVGTREEKERGVWWVYFFCLNFVQK